MKCNRTQEECTAPGVCLELGCQGKLVGGCDQSGFLEQARDNLRAQMGGVSGAANVKQRDRLQEAADAIRAKLKEKNALYQHYLLHIDKMREQEDLHGGWDGFANASEVSHYVDGLLFALDALGEQR